MAAIVIVLGLIQMTLMWELYSISESLKDISKSLKENKNEL